MAQISGTNVAAPVVPFTTDDIYATHEAKYGKGGWHEVATIAERDAIINNRKEPGMAVYVLADKTVYILLGNNTWEKLTVEVIDNVTSTDTDKALSANMGRELLSEIDNLKARGRFLSLWKCTTGLPETLPTTTPYDYHTGDYFIVSEVAGSTPTGRYKHQIYMEGIDSSETNTYSVNYEFESDSSTEYTQFSMLYGGLHAEGYFDRNALAATGTFHGLEVNWVSVDAGIPIIIFSQGEERLQLGNTASATLITDTVTPLNEVTEGESVNYRPNGSQYTGEASTTVETEEVKVNDTYYYDGTEWKLQKDTGKTLSFVNIAGDPYDNTELAAALNLKANSADLASVATSGSYDDLSNKPTIPAAQILSDWNQSSTSAADYIKNKPTIPTKTSLLTNDSGFLTQHLNIKTVNGQSIIGTGNVNILTYNPFPTEWRTSGSLEEVVDSILSYSQYTSLGMAYLGGIEGSCTPFGYGNVECKVEFMLDGLAVLSVNSSDIYPHSWFYNTASGDYTWKTFSTASASTSSISGADTAKSITIDGINYNLPTTPELIQSDWAQTDNTSKDFIKNKPTIPTEYVISSDLGTLEETADWATKLWVNASKGTLVASFLTTPDNTHYPSEKLVKDNLDLINNSITSLLPLIYAGL